MTPFGTLSEWPQLRPAGDCRAQVMCYLPMTIESKESIESLDTAVTSAPQARRTPTLRRRIARILLLALGVYLAFCVAIAWETVRPKNHPLGTTPAASGLPFEPAAFTSADGTRLAGWFMPGPNKSGLRGIIILCHGVDSTRAGMLWKASVLHKAGFATFVFDFRGRGESGPSLCTIGYREVDDLLAAINYVRSRPDSAKLPLGVFGESQGGAVALMGTARSSEVRAVVAESPFARLDHAVDNHFRKVFGMSAPLVSFPVRLVGQALIRCRCCDVSPVDEITRIAPRPVLLIQDADDSLCPPSETAALLRAAGSCASLWTVDGAGHIGAEYTAPEEFGKRVTAFFENHL
jgi:fermentation-respiration switch protein FrsA (DUF1100 family)